MEKLKKCPFCGGEATVSTDVPVRGTIAICCENQRCKVKPAVVKWTVEEAANAWNERA